MRYVQRILGTPTEKTWPGVSFLQDWNEDFPLWPILKIKNFLPSSTCCEVVDMIEVRVVIFVIILYLFI